MGDELCMPVVELRVTQRFDAPPERVFDAWLDPTIASAWLFATASRPLARVEIDPRVGGSFRMLDRPGRGGTKYAGEYLEIAPPCRLAFTLSADPGVQEATRVKVEIMPTESGCELTLTHENVSPDDASRTEGRWIGTLYGLGETLKGRQEL